jgi:hypothetical protein
MSDRRESIKARLAKKLIAPIAATAASYAAKKVPELVQEKVLPRLKERRAGRARASADTTARILAARSNVTDQQREEHRRQRAQHRRERRERASTT